MKAKGTYSIFISCIKYILILFFLILLFSNRAYAKQTDYEYDDSGRVIKVIYEDGSYETYEYDKNGNLTEVIFHSELSTEEDDDTGDSGGTEAGGKDNENSGGTETGGNDSGSSGSNGTGNSGSENGNGEVNDTGNHKSETGNSKMDSTDDNQNGDIEGIETNKSEQEIDNTENNKKTILSRSVWKITVLIVIPIIMIILIGIYVVYRKNNNRNNSDETDVE